RAAFSQRGSGAIAAKAKKMAAAPQASQRQTTAAGGIGGGVGGNSSELSHARQAMSARCAAIQPGRGRTGCGGELVSDGCRLPRARANMINAAMNATMNRNPRYNATRSW